MFVWFKSRLIAPTATKSRSRSGFSNRGEVALSNRGGFAVAPRRWLPLSQLAARTGLAARLVRFRQTWEPRGDAEITGASGHRGCSRERQVDAYLAAGSRREIEQDQPRDQDPEDDSEDVRHPVEGEVAPEEPEPAAGNSRRDPADSGDENEDIPDRNCLPP